MLEGTLIILNTRVYKYNIIHIQARNSEEKHGTGSFDLQYELTIDCL